jgi:hypothetical protein
MADREKDVQINKPRDRDVKIAITNKTKRYLSYRFGMKVGKAETGDTRVKILSGNHATCDQGENGSEELQVTESKLSS